MSRSKILAAVENLALDQLRQVRRVPEVVDEPLEQALLEVPGLEAALALGEQVADRGEAALEHRFVERLLARKVVVDARLVEADPAGDLANGDAGEPALGEQGLGSVENPRRGAPGFRGNGLRSFARHAPT